MTTEIKRQGKTVVTSVSVSREFEGLIKQYNLSPTDVFRKGMAVELYERGVGHFITKTNQTRAEEIQELLKVLKQWGKLMEELEKKRDVVNKIDELIKKGSE